MENKKQVDLYQAIQDMRTISKNGDTFKIRFRKWNRATVDGGDLVTIESARMRAKASDEDVPFSEYKLFLTDTDTGRPLVCWECLVVEFNDMRTVVA
jgi:hypothetical protein